MYILVGKTKRRMKEILKRWQKEKTSGVGEVNAIYGLEQRSKKMEKYIRHEKKSG